MKSSLIRAYSKLLQITIRFLCRLTGKGGGKFAQLIPPGQTYLLSNYFGNLNFQVDTSYPMETSVWLAGVYEIITTNFFKEVLRQGDVVLDIGANCGALTLVAASLVKDGKLYAFEPAQSVRSRLQGNIDLNPHLKDVVTVLPYGIGLTRSKGFYNEDPNYRGNGSLQVQAQGIAIDILSLDEWVALEKLDKIDFIKIDVEGMEYDVLRGGKSVLETHHPMIYFETLQLFFERTSHSIETIYEFLADLGYKVVTPTKPHKEIPVKGPYPANSVAIHCSRADRLFR